MFRALSAVYERQEPFIPERLIEEMDAIADGICDVLGSDCDVTEWQEKVRGTLYR